MELIHQISMEQETLHSHTDVGDTMKIQVPEFKSEAEEASWWSSHAGLRAIEAGFARKYGQSVSEVSVEPSDGKPPYKHKIKTEAETIRELKGETPITISTEVDPNYKDEEDDYGKTQVHRDFADDAESSKDSD